MGILAVSVAPAEAVQRTIDPELWAIATSQRAGRWDSANDVLREALEADLAAEATAPRYRSLTHAHWARFQQQLGPQAAAEHRARVAFEYLHAEILTGPFHPGCARVQRTLDDGTHNCLTATLLYLDACRSCGLAAIALATPGHVCVGLRIDGRDFRVETTSPRWELQPRSHGHPTERPISDTALVGRVYYNLGLQAAERGDFARAVVATRRGYELDPAHDAARANLLATLHNWSLELARRGEHAEALRVLAEAVELKAERAPTKKTEAALRLQTSSSPSHLPGPSPTPGGTSPAPR